MFLFLKQLAIMEDLIVKAKHFKDTTFIGYNGGCALEKAAKEQFNSVLVFEGIYSISIDKVSYLHDDYDENHFLDDKQLAQTHSFDDTVIRTIKLEKRKEVEWVKHFKI